MVDIMEPMFTKSWNNHPGTYLSYRVPSLTAEYRRSYLGRPRKLRLSGRRWVGTQEEENSSKSIDAAGEVWG